MSDHRLRLPQLQDHDALSGEACRFVPATSGRLVVRIKSTNICQLCVRSRSCACYLCAHGVHLHMDRHPAAFVRWVLVVVTSFRGLASRFCV